MRARTGARGIRACGSGGRPPAARCYGDAARAPVCVRRFTRRPCARECALGRIVDVPGATVGVADWRCSGTRAGSATLIATRGLGHATSPPVHAAGAARRPRALCRALGRVIDGPCYPCAAVGVADRRCCPQFEAVVSFEAAIQRCAPALGSLRIDTPEVTAAAQIAFAHRLALYTRILI